MHKFLPVSIEDGKKIYRDFTQFDIIIVSGDAYYDHPLSGTAIIARLLDNKGYRVGIIPQPLANKDYLACGRPKLFFCITSGLLDSMLANYTPMLKKRENVLVPERALMVYTQKAKEHFKGTITVIGGVEATIRRFTHFDYKDNSLRRGILNDTKADLLAFGNAENAILLLAERIKKSGEGQFEKIRGNLYLQTIQGIAYRVRKNEINPKIKMLPSYEECVSSREKFNLLSKTYCLFPEEAFIEPCGEGYIQHNIPPHALTEKEMDYIYSLPFNRNLHPRTKNFKSISYMVEMLKASVVIGRGCFGSCSFCIIPLVQGKQMAKRSLKNIMQEIEMLYSSGIRLINDLTLPTINMFGSKCRLYNHELKIYSHVLGEEITICIRKEHCNQKCVGCKNRILSDDLIILLEGIEKLNKKYNASLELRSAVRHDIILNQKKLFSKIMQFTKRLKAAPECLSGSVLKQMNKGTSSDFKKFLNEFNNINKIQKTAKNLVPYFIAAHPGCEKKDMEATKKFCDENNIFVNLTQVFTPTPGTLSTAMYYTGISPLTNEKIYVPRAFREKKDQKNILLSKDNYEFDENG